MTSVLTPQPSHKPSRRPSRRSILLWGVPAAVLVLVLASATALFQDVWKEKSMLVRGSTVAMISNDQLATVQRTRVFFGHQSVGMNILDGVTAVYGQHGVAAPPVEENGRPGPGSGFISQKFIGENEKPLLKFEDFDKTIRSGLGNQIDVAMMELCFLDITTQTDVVALFERYRDTIAALQRDYPAITFVHITVPLTTDSSLRNRVKIALGGSDRFGQGENVARERYNQLLRNEYGDKVFDLAAIESTQPDGQRQQFEYRGQPYFALYPGYASDMGHLNPVGSERAGTAFLQSIANASHK